MSLDPGSARVALWSRERRSAEVRNDVPLDANHKRTPVLVSTSVLLCIVSWRAWSLCVIYPCQNFNISDGCSVLGSDSVKQSRST